MSVCSIHVPPLRQVPSLHKNESMKTEQREKKDSWFTLLVVIIIRFSYRDVDMLNFERSRRALIRFLYKHRRSTNKLVGIVSIKSFSCQCKVYSRSKEGD